MSTLHVPELMSNLDSEMWIFPRFTGESRRTLWVYSVEKSLPT
jgi:hypothetical protein